MAAPSPVRHHQTINPDEWNKWLQLLGALGAIFLWLWRHSIGAAARWLLDAFQAPKLIRQQNEAITKLGVKLDEVRHTASFAVATARIAWSFVERPVLQFDPFGQCVCVNDFTTRAFVRQQSEFLGNGWLTMVHDDDLDRVERMWKACVADKRNFVHEFRLHPREGEPITVFDRAEVMRDQTTGEVLGWHHLMTIQS